VAPILLGACDRQSSEKAQPQASASAAAKGGELKGTLDRSHKGNELPPFTLADPEDEKLSLPSLKGKPVLINLWATWCAPCIAELPTLQAISNRADMNVAVVTVSQDTGDPAKVRMFLDQRGFAQLPAWLDPKGDLAFHYQVQTLPTSIYYDAGGREVWRFIGGRDWSSADTAALFAEDNT
jgi:thiol-disulfide isomerase/thioredoxin